MTPDGAICVDSPHAYNLKMKIKKFELRHYPLPNQESLMGISVGRPESKRNCSAEEWELYESQYRHDFPPTPSGRIKALK
eukprot:UN25852